MKVGKERNPVDRKASMGGYRYGYQRVSKGFNGDVRSAQVRAGAGEKWTFSEVHFGYYQEKGQGEGGKERAPNGEGGQHERVSVVYACACNMKKRSGI